LIKMPLLLVIVMLKSMIGQHQVKQLWAVQSFIRHQYFENEQITLYQMRWNPKNPGSHQYASDIEWADKIADNMKKDYERLGIKKDKIRRNYYISNK